MENLIVPGEWVQLTPRVRRLTAPNPGMMTGPGTNSYVVGVNELALIDPGPAIESHIAALIAAVGNRLRYILATHTHLDHSPAVRALKDATGAAVLGMPAPPQANQDQSFAPDRVPVDGDMGAYLRSLEALLSLDAGCIAPGHGHLIDRPHDEARKLIAHRLRREQKVLDGFATRNPATLDELVAVVYADTPVKLHGAAKRSLYAHLLKLEADARVMRDGERWRLK